MRVLVVGHGVRGRQWCGHARRLRGLSVAGVVDPDPHAREHATGGGLAAWERLADALAAGGADAVIVASPPECHVEHALGALAAGRPALVEKPLAPSAAEARQLAAAAAASGVPLLVGQNFALRRTELAIRRGLGVVGSLRWCSITTVRPADDRDPLWDMGIHHLDLLRRRFGATPSAVSCEAEADSVRATLSWDDGRAARWLLRAGGSLYHHTEWLEAERGAVAVSGRSVRTVVPGRRPRPVVRPLAADAERTLLRALARAGGGVPAELAAAENVGTVALVEAAAASRAAGGRPVRLSPAAVAA